MVLKMKKSSLISLLLLSGIIGLLCISPVAALTPEGLWGMGTGDQLYYKVTANNTGEEIITYARVDVTSVYNGTIALYGYVNIVNATTYVYTGTAWVESYPDVEWAAYNTSTFLWYGAAQVTLGFPNPAPIPFSWLIVNSSIATMAFYTGWGLVASSQDGDTVTYANATDSLIVTYNSTTGVCTNNTHLINGYLWTKQEYVGEENPFPESKIPGYNPILIVSILSISALLIGLKIKNKK
jgi:hypothetical protein